MKIARCYSFDDVRIEDAPVPRIGPGEALAKVRICGVCTGEAMPWYVNQKCPTVLGHEPVGEIVEVGRGVRNFRRGDRVFFHHHTSCGWCANCLRDHPTLCREFRETKLDPGGFAEYVRIPKLNLEKDTLKLPKSVTDEDGILIEPLACSIHAIKRLNLRRGDTVLVIGCGIMGLLNIQVAQIYGARFVLACDLKPARRRLALRYGAKFAFPPNLAEVHRRTNDRGADCVIVGPPNSRALEFGLEAAAPGATIQLFAPMPPAAAVKTNYHNLYFKEQSITTSYSCDATDTRAALRLLSAQKIKTRGLITHRFPLPGVASALRLTYEGRDSIIKAVIRLS